MLIASGTENLWRVSLKIIIFPETLRSQRHRSEIEDFVKIMYGTYVRMI